MVNRGSTHHQAARDLLQTGLPQAASNVTVVTTAQQLQDAVLSGTPYIEIQAHIDLSMLPDAESGVSGEGGSLLGTIPTPVESISGACQGAPDDTVLGMPSEGSPFRSLQPGQCVLFADRNIMKIAFGRLYLSNMYVQFMRTSRGSFRQALLAKGPPSGNSGVRGENIRLWMKTVTFQGQCQQSGGTYLSNEKQCERCGLEVWDGAMVYAQDCMFADFHGERMAWVGGGSSLSMARVVFEGNNIEDIFSANYEGVGMIEAQPEGDKVTKTSLVRLEDVEFRENSVNFALKHSIDLLADARGSTTDHAIFYSDNPNLTVCTLKGAKGPYGSDNPAPQCMSNATLALERVAEGSFIDLQDRWVIRVEEAVRNLPRVTVGEPRGMSTGVIVGVSISAAVAAVTIAAVIVFFFKRKRRTQNRKPTQKLPTIVEVPTHPHKTPQPPNMHAPFPIRQNSGQIGMHEPDSNTPLPRPPIARPKDASSHLHMHGGASSGISGQNVPAGAMHSLPEIRSNEKGVENSATGRMNFMHQQVSRSRLDAASVVDGSSSFHERLWTLPEESSSFANMTRSRSTQHNPSVQILSASTSASSPAAVPPPAAPCKIISG